jgi:hypothetical protein
MLSRANKEFHFEREVRRKTCIFIFQYFPRHSAVKLSKINVKDKNEMVIGHLKIRILLGALKNGRFPGKKNVRNI